MKLLAEVVVWLISDGLIYKFKPPQSSVLSLFFNEILLYIVYCNNILNDKSAVESGDWRYM